MGVLPNDSFRAGVLGKDNSAFESTFLAAFADTLSKEFVTPLLVPLLATAVTIETLLLACDVETLVLKLGNLSRVWSPPAFKNEFDVVIILTSVCLITGGWLEWSPKYGQVQGGGSNKEPFSADFDSDIFVFSLKSLVCCFLVGLSPFNRGKLFARTKVLWRSVGDAGLIHVDARRFVHLVSLLCFLKKDKKRGK